MLTFKQYSFPNRHTLRIECNPDHYFNSPDIEHLTFVPTRKKTLLLRWRKVRSTYYHHCVFTNVHTDRPKIFGKDHIYCYIITVLSTGEGGGRGHPLLLFLWKKKEYGVLCADCPPAFNTSPVYNKLPFYLQHQKFLSVVDDNDGPLHKSIKMRVKKHSHRFPQTHISQTRALKHNGY